MGIHMSTHPDAITLGKNFDFSRRQLMKLGAGVAGTAALAACAPGNSVTPTKLASAPPKELTGDVVIWDREGDLFKVFDEALKGFRTLHPKLNVKHVAVNVDAKLPSALITGTNVPDGSFWEDVNIQGSAAHLTDLTDRLKPYLAETIQYKIDVNTVKGRIVGVPWDLDPGLLFYRDDILKDAGVDPKSIASYDDLLAAARKIKAKNPKARPIHLEGDTALGQLWLEMFANQQGTGMVDKNGKLQLDSDKYRQILTWMQTVVKEELGAPSKLGTPSDLASFENGTQSLMLFAIWFDYSPQMLFKQTAGKWRTMELPAWTAGGARSGVMGGSSFVIPSQSKNPEAAWALFEYLVFKPEGYKAVYGPSSVYPNGLNTSLPSYKPALNPGEPLFKPVAGLGYQDIWTVFTKAAAQVPAGYRIAPWYNQAVPYLGNNLQKMLAGQMTVDDCLKTSTDQIQKNLIDRAH